MIFRILYFFNHMLFEIVVAFAYNLLENAEVESPIEAAAISSSFAVLVVYAH